MGSSLRKSPCHRLLLVCSGLAFAGGLRLLCVSSTAAAADKGKVDFAKDIQPILKESCLRCHGAPDTKDPKKKPAGNLRLDDKTSALKGGKSGKAILPGKGKDSLLYKLLQGPTKVGGREIPAMPKSGPGQGAKLDDDKIELIRQWIDEGAKWGELKPVDYAKEIQPIFNDSCVRCHGAPDPKDPKKRPQGNLRLDDKANVLKGGKSGKAIVPGKSADSLLYKLLQGPTKVGGREIATMPKSMPGAGDSRLEADKIELIKQWIDQGAK